MKGSGRGWLRALTWAAALTAAAVTALLLADLVAARRRAPADAERIAALEEAVRTDSAAAVELDAERQRQTELSMAREARGRRLGWWLLAASAVFLTGAKGLRRVPGVRKALPRAVGLPPAPGGAGIRSPLPLRERARVRAPQLDLTFVDQLVCRRGRGPEAVIPILQEIQLHYRYLPDAALQRVCELTEITPARIAGVAGFYSRFRRTPVGEHVVRVCHGTACHVAGVEHVHDELRRRLGIPQDGDTDPGHRVTLDPVACLGCCSLAPVMMIGDDAAGHLTPTTAWPELQRRIGT